MKWKIIGFILGFGCLPIGAADQPYRFGAELFSCQPTGTLINAVSSSTGTGLGLFLEKDLWDGHGLRWDLTSVAVFPAKDRGDPATGHTINPRFFSTGSTLSYLYHLNASHRGPYFLAGLGARAFNGSAEIASGNPPLPPKNQIGGDAIPAFTQYSCDTGIKLAFQIGAGYNFSDRWGVTVRYQGLQSLGHTLATLEAGVNIRF